MAWDLPSTPTAGTTIATVANWATPTINCLRYLKGLDGVPTIQAGLIIDNTLGTEYLQVPILTTTQRDAITPVNGMIIYNSTDGMLQQYDNAWISFKDISKMWLTSQAQGDAFYASGETTIARLGASTSGYVLTTKGASANPEWAASGGSTEKILNLTDDFMSGSLEDGEVGSLGWGFTVTGAVTRVASAANHPGILKLATGATTNNTAYMFPSATSSDSLILPTDLWEQTFIVYLDTIANIRIQIGANTNIASEATNYQAYFGFDTSTDTYWMMCSAGATQSRVATDVTPGNAWYKLKIKRTAAGVEFYINDVLKGTETTKVPVSLNMTYGLYIKTLAEAAAYVSIDFSNLTLPGITR